MCPSFGAAARLYRRSPADPPLPEIRHGRGGSGAPDRSDPRRSRPHGLRQRQRDRIRTQPPVRLSQAGDRPQAHGSGAAPTCPSARRACGQQRQHGPSAGNGGPAGQWLRCAGRRAHPNDAGCRRKQRRLPRPGRPSGPLPNAVRPLLRRLLLPDFLFRLAAGFRSRCGKMQRHVSGQRGQALFPPHSGPGQRRHGVGGKPDALCVAAQRFCLSRPQGRRGAPMQLRSVHRTAGKTGESNTAIVDTAIAGSGNGRRHQAG